MTATSFVSSDVAPLSAVQRFYAWIILVGATCASVAVVPWASDFPIVFPKLVILLTVSILLALWGTKALWRGSALGGEPSQAVADIRGALVLFGVAILVRAAIQPQLHVALWGMSARNIAGLLYLSFVIIALGAIAAGRALTARAVHNGILVAGAFTSAYGMLQITGHDFISWMARGPLTTFGNIDHSASWHAIIVVAAVAAIFQRDRKLITLGAVTLVGLMALVVVINLFLAPWKIEQGCCCFSLGSSG